MKLSNRFTDELRVRLKGDHCIYCGDVATTDEHFPPATYSRRGVIAPSCRECNAIAGTNWASDFEERVQHVKRTLRERYAKLLATADWDKEEIKELGRNLHSEITQWQEKKDSIRQRLAWNVELYLGLIDHGQLFAQASAEWLSIIRTEKENLTNSIPGRRNVRRTSKPNRVNHTPSWPEYPKNKCRHAFMNSGEGAMVSLAQELGIKGPRIKRWTAEFSRGK